MSAFLADAAPGLGTVIGRADAILVRAVAAQLGTGPEPTDDVYRAIRVSSTDALEALAGQPPVYVPEAAEALAEDDPLGLIDRLGLDAIDHALVVLALLPELETRFERVFGFLNGDPQRSRPTLGLALRMLVGERAWSDGSLGRLGEERPLRRLALLAPPPAGGPLAAAPLVPMRSLVERLLEPEANTWAGALVTPAPIGLPPDDLEAARKAWARARQTTPARLTVGCDDPSVRRLVAADLASRLSQGAPAPDMADATAAGRDVLFVPPADTADGAVARRDALLARAVLYWEGDPAMLVGYPGPAIAAGPVGCDPVGPLVVLPGPGRAGRACRWRTALGSAELAGAAAARYALSGEAIERAGRTAKALAAGDGRDVTLDDIAAGARAEARRALVDVATQVDPRVTWDDIVLPAATEQQLRELCNRVVHAATVRDEWAFGSRRIGQGVTALFAGASGTGKSMAAELVASELGLPLWRVDLARVVSKYIGETEKNLDRVFAAAESTGAMLVFDEADALFGRRGEIRQGNDRYANLEVSYLLQRMEAYTGVAVLTTNLRANLDDAFVRRLAFTIAFPFPAAAERTRLWQSAWPEATPVSESVAPEVLAERFALSGANIAGAALAAAYAAAADGGVVSEAHVLTAVDGELAKLGAHPEAEDKS